MKKRMSILVLLSLFMILACRKEKEDNEEKKIGYLTLNITAGTNSKSALEVTDLILRIFDSQKVKVLEKRIGDLPTQIALAVGSYTIEAYSAEFSEPQFNAPCYSTKKSAVISANTTTNVTLVCEQSNAGVVVVWANEFSLLYQNFQATIRSETGNLTYSATETKTGYFLPGTVSISISADGEVFNAGNITLSAKDLVTATLRPKVLPSGSLSINVSIVETVNQREVEILLDPDSVINSQEKPYSVADAIIKQGETGVWITGYIVGSKPSSGWDFINSSTWQASNIMLADNINETNDLNCIPVELGTGTFRTNLNLLAHPELLHRKIVIKGHLATYNSRPGLRTITNYVLK